MHHTEAAVVVQHNSEPHTYAAPQTTRQHSGAIGQRLLHIPHPHLHLRARLAHLLDSAKSERRRAHCKLTYSVLSSSPKSDSTSASQSQQTSTDVSNRQDTIESSSSTTAVGDSCSSVSIALQHGIASMSGTGPAQCGLDERCNFELLLANSTHIEAKWHSTDHGLLAREMRYQMRFTLSDAPMQAVVIDTQNNAASIDESPQSSSSSATAAVNLSPLSPMQQFTIDSSTATAASLPADQSVGSESAGLMSLSSTGAEEESEPPAETNSEFDDDQVDAFEEQAALDSIADSDQPAEPLSYIAGDADAALAPTPPPVICVIAATIWSTRHGTSGNDSGAGYCRLRHVMQAAGMFAHELGSKDSCHGYELGTKQCEKQTTIRNWWA